MDIFGCNEELEIGKRYDQFVMHRDGEQRKLPFVVLRRATHEEWLQSIRERRPNYAGHPLAKDGHFYAISMD